MHNLVGYECDVYLLLFQNSTYYQFHIEYEHAITYGENLPTTTMYYIVKIVIESI